MPTETFQRPRPLAITILALCLLQPAFSAHHYEKFFQVDGGPQYMYYFSKFFVGTPEREQSAIIDTGSDTLAFPCDQCQSGDCGTHQDPRFFTVNSKSFNFEMRCANRSYYHDAQVCQFTKSYAEGSSLYGFLADDYVRFKNAKVVQDGKLRQFNSLMTKDLRLKAEFGCTTKESGLFKSQFADGILGLDSASSLIESIEQENSQDVQKVFSFGLCFHATGGIMSVDLRNKNYPDDKIVMLNQSIHKFTRPIVAPYNDFDNYYNIEVSHFGLLNKKIYVPSITMMIDSGTTFTHLPTSYANKIFAALNVYCRRNRNKCGKLPQPNFNSDTCLELKQPDKDFHNEDELYASFPPIKIFLTGSRQPYLLHPKNYFYKEYNPDLPENVTKVCMALKGNEQGKIILGAFSMIDYYFYFDRKDRNVKIFKEDCYLRTTQLLAKRTERILAATLPIERGAVLGSFGFVFGAAVFFYLLLRLFRRKKVEPELVDLPLALNNLIYGSLSINSQ